MQSPMIFREAKQVELVVLLAGLGFQPNKVRHPDYWYRSPLRQEQTASFKVNRSRNIWYDHGEGIGGNIIDFAARFFLCDAKTAAQKILELNGHIDLSFHPQPYRNPQAGEKKESRQGRISIKDTRVLQDGLLLAYLKERNIPLAIATAFCKEVDFSLYGRRHTTIGFQNRSGGFELRSKHFKGSSAPKDITFFDNGKQGVCVFEGFFDFLSFEVIRPPAAVNQTNTLVLNSLSFFQKSRALMERHDKIFLFLDQGTSGKQSAARTLQWNKEINSLKYANCSHYYKNHDDLNAWLKNQSQKRQHQQSIKKRGRGL